MFRTAFGPDPSFELFDVLRRELDRAFEAGPSGQAAPLASGTWPELVVTDEDEALVVRAEVPGLAEADVHVELHDGVLTLKGERTSAPREGFEVLRRERPALRFARSLRLGTAVDAERTVATVKDGVLTVRLAKSEATRPRRIPVRGQA